MLSKTTCIEITNYSHSPKTNGPIFNFNLSVIYLFTLFSVLMTSESILVTSHMMYPKINLYIIFLYFILENINIITMIYSIIDTITPAPYLIIITIILVLHLSFVFHLYFIRYIFHSITQSHMPLLFNCASAC